MTTVFEMLPSHISVSVFKPGSASKASLLLRHTWRAEDTSTCVTATYVRDPDWVLRSLLRSGLSLLLQASGEYTRRRNTSFSAFQINLKNNKIKSFHDAKWYINRKWYQSLSWFKHKKAHFSHLHNTLFSTNWIFFPPAGTQCNKSHSSLRYSFRIAQLGSSDAELGMEFIGRSTTHQVLSWVLLFNLFRVQNHDL